MERRTRAPAPSDCSMAKKALRIARGTDILAGFEVVVGRMNGSPSNMFAAAVVLWRLDFSTSASISTWERRKARNTIDTNATVIVERSKMTFIRSMRRIYTREP